ncbi:DUF192 domain-containing protein [bacterium]|nr:MAG: DUF192 domain-containing protein [bacterium]
MQIPKYTTKQKIQIIVYIILIVIFLSYLMWNKYGSQIRTYQLRQEYIRSMQSLAYIHNSTVACASMRVESDCICNDDRSWQVTCFDKKIKIADSEIQIAVATNTSEQNEGMMEFRELPVNYGMLFTFSDNQVRNFWMKDTYLPLTIIFMDENYQVVNIADATPLNLAGVSSTKPTKYVLEIQQDLNNKLNIQIGSHILIDL